mmetsp:Transcript_9266/g.15591  ORF Transcript_9266/g.15591 Transcript_9266/m.15591 type:complete len:316 (+) Transcript_9266:533-1480(+)
MVLIVLLHVLLTPLGEESRSAVVQVPGGHEEVSGDHVLDRGVGRNQLVVSHEAALEVGGALGAEEEEVDAGENGEEDERVDKDHRGNESVPLESHPLVVEADLGGELFLQLKDLLELGVLVDLGTFVRLLGHNEHSAQVHVLLLVEDPETLGLFVVHFVLVNLLLLHHLSPQPQVGLQLRDALVKSLVHRVLLDPEVDERADEADEEEGNEELEEHGHLRVVVDAIDIFIEEVHEVGGEELVLLDGLGRLVSVGQDEGGGDDGSSLGPSHHVEQIGERNPAELVLGVAELVLGLVVGLDLHVGEEVRRHVPLVLG